MQNIGLQCITSKGEAGTPVCEYFSRHIVDTQTLSCWNLMLWSSFNIPAVNDSEVTLACLLVLSCEKGFPLLDPMYVFSHVSGVLCN